MPDLDRHPDAKRARAFTPYWVSLFIASTVLLAVIAAGMVAGRRRQEERHAEGARLAVGQTRAADILGIDPSTLHRRGKKA